MSAENTTQNLIGRLSSLRKDYVSEEQKDFDQMVEDLQITETIKELSGHLAIKSFVERLQSRINEIDQILKSKRTKDLPDRERDNLLDRKDLYTEFIQYFDYKAKIASYEAIVSDLEQR